MAEQTLPDTYRTAETYGFDVDRERERMVFGVLIDWENDSDLSGGLAHLGEGDYAVRPGLSLPELKELVEANYISEEQTHNASPSVGEFIEHGEELVFEFGIDTEHVRYISYFVSPYREDARIDIPGIYVTDLGESDFNTVDHHFSQKFGKRYDDHYHNGADERNLRGEVSAWWD